MVEGLGRTICRVAGEVDVCCDEWVGGQFWLGLLVGGLVGAGLGGLEWLAA